MKTYDEFIAESMGAPISQRTDDRFNSDPLQNRMNGNVVNLIDGRKSQPLALRKIKGIGLLADGGVKLFLCSVENNVHNLIASIDTNDILDKKNLVENPNQENLYVGLCLTKDEADKNPRLVDYLTNDAQCLEEVDVKNENGGVVKKHIAIISTVDKDGYCDFDALIKLGDYLKG